MSTTTTAIVRELIKLDRDRQRAAFAVILAFLRRESGCEAVDSLHDFVTAKCAKQLAPERREQILSCVANAVRKDELAALQPIEKP